MESDKIDCYICSSKEEYAKSVDSEEHIIPKSLGSPLSSYRLLCKIHNQKFGDTIDAELFRQLGHVSDMLGVNLNSKNKVITAYTIDNEEYKTSSGMSGTFTLEFETANYTYRVTGRTIEEAKEKAIKEIKKHPKVFTDQEYWKDHIENADFKPNQPKNDKLWFKSQNSNDPKVMVISENPLFVKAFIKIAVNFYLFKKLDISYISSMIEILKNDSEEYERYPQNIHWANDFTIERTYLEDEISHVIKIEGDPVKGYLVAIVELFSWYSVVVFLNLTYNGPRIEESWGYDVLKKEPFIPEVIIKASKTDMLNMQFNTFNSSKILEDKFLRIVEIFEKHRW